MGKTNLAKNSRSMSSRIHLYKLNCRISAFYDADKQYTNRLIEEGHIRESASWNIPVCQEVG
jgi:hypothetical protein